MSVLFVLTFSEWHKSEKANHCMAPGFGHFSSILAYVMVAIAKRLGGAFMFFFSVLRKRANYGTRVWQFSTINTSYYTYIYLNTLPRCVNINKLLI